MTLEIGVILYGDLVKDFDFDFAYELVTGHSGVVFTSWYFDRLVGQKILCTLSPYDLDHEALNW